MGCGPSWKGQVVRVVLIAVDSVSGLIYPPVAAQNEERADGWGGLLERACRGVDLQKLRGICSMGPTGSGVLTECAGVGGTRSAARHAWRSLSGDLGAGGRVRAAGRVQSGG